uniref:Uncharacterized protein n=1 Tax=Daphnia galeata TaxID=27404 RepID=A0A8J2RC29_9CRUS|nr:unnamed protein product [Daphnia galeata]
MKLALIFVLSTLVVISHQQFYQQRPTSRGMLWWLPYYSPQRVLNDYQPLYNDQPAEELPFPRQSSSSGSNGELLNEGTDGGQDYVEDDGQNEYGDTQSRNRGFTGVSSSFGGFSRYRPSFYNERPDGRFFLNFGNNNRLLKTATFQLTSTVTLTTVSRCVPLIQFAVSPPPACRRKRSVIDDAEDVDQFIIDPSETLELTPTALPGRQSRETRQVMDKSNSDDSLISYSEC